MRRPANWHLNEKVIEGTSKGIYSFFSILQYQLHIDRLSLTFQRVLDRIYTMAEALHHMHPYIHLCAHHRTAKSHDPRIKPVVEIQRIQGRSNGVSLVCWWQVLRRHTACWHGGQASRPGGLVPRTLEIWNPSSTSTNPRYFKSHLNRPQQSLIKQTQTQENFTMATLSPAFQTAVVDSKKLLAKPDNEELLNLYGTFPMISHLLHHLTPSSSLQDRLRRGHHQGSLPRHV